MGVSCCGTWALGAPASVAAVRGLSSSGAWADLLHAVWDLPGPGVEPMPFELQGGFLTTGPPGTPPIEN